MIHYLAAIVFDFTAGRREQKAFLLPIYGTEVLLTQN